MNHEELRSKALQNDAVRTEYEASAPEFELLRSLLRARNRAGMTQAQVAERMGTQPSAVTRLEASLISGKHSPSLRTLRRYAEAVGAHLEIRVEELA